MEVSKKVEIHAGTKRDFEATVTLSDVLQMSVSTAKQAILFQSTCSVFKQNERTKSLKASTCMYIFCFF